MGKGRLAAALPHDTQYVVPVPVPVLLFELLRALVVVLLVPLVPLVSLVSLAECSF